MAPKRNVMGKTNITGDKSLIVRPPSMGLNRYKLKIDRIPTANSKVPKIRSGVLSLSTILFINMLPIPIPVRKTANMPEKAYMEVCRNKINCRVHISSYDKAVKPLNRIEIRTMCRTTSE